MSEIDPALLADLLREAMKDGKFPFVTVVSNSMSPLIRRGDQIRIAPVTAEQLQPGDIIVYKGPANLITHRYWGRLTEKGRIHLVTRGDRPQHFDKPFDASTLIGEVIGRRRQSHFLDFSGGGGKWLNNHLANLAKLEIRLFAAPPGFSEGIAEQVPESGGRFSGLTDSLIIRLIRRLLYSWAIILTVIFSVITNDLKKNGED